MEPVLAIDPFLLIFCHLVARTPHNGDITFHGEHVSVTHRTDYSSDGKINRSDATIPRFRFSTGPMDETRKVP